MASDIQQYEYIRCCRYGGFGHATRKNNTVCDKCMLRLKNSRTVRSPAGRTRIIPGGFVVETFRDDSSPY